MENPITQRLSAFIEYTGKSKRQLEKELGVSNGTLSGALKSGRSIGSDILYNIFSTYSSLSANWLFTGSGEMIDLKNSNKNVSECVPFAQENVPESVPFVPKSGNESANSVKDINLDSRLVSETALLASQVHIIDAQSRTISALEKTISSQQRIIDMLEAQLDAYKKSNPVAAMGFPILP